MSVLLHFLLYRVGLAAAETQTTETERKCLVRHAEGKHRLAEIGVWHGVTTCKLRAAMANTGTLFAVDPYPPGRLGFSMQRVIAHREVSKVANGEVVWVRQTGVQAASYFESTGRRWDFIFIDGDHSYDGLRADWENLSPLVLPGGVVALHDSCSWQGRNIEDAGSVRYTRAVVLKDTHFEVVDSVDSLTVLRRLPRA